MLFCCNVFVICWLLNNVISFDKIISQSLINYFGPTDVTLHLSNTTVDKLFELNMEIDFICVGKGHEHINRTFPMKYLSTQTISYKNKINLQADVFETSITLPSEHIIIPSVKLYYVDNPNKEFIDSIPLTYKFKDESSSIVHYLYKTNQINHISFSIVKDKKYGDLTLYFGGLPSEVTTQYKYTTKCKVPIHYDKWGCSLNTVNIKRLNNTNKMIYVNKYPFYFQSNTKGIHAPKDFMMFMYENVIKDLLDKHLCWISKVNDSLEEQIKCYRNTSSVLIDYVEIVINGKVFTMIKKDLFLIYADGNEFIIVNNKYSDNEWIIGNVFLNTYITYFDYSDKSITFYTEEQLETIVGYGKEGEEETIKNILMLCSIIMVLNIIFMFILKITKKIDEYW